MKIYRIVRSVYFKTSLINVLSVCSIKVFKVNLVSCNMYVGIFISVGTYPNQNTPDVKKLRPRI